MKGRHDYNEFLENLTLSKGVFRSHSKFLLLVTTFLIAYFLVYTPLPDLGGDAGGKWNVFRQLVLTDIDRVLSDTHHHMRWANYIFAWPSLLVFGDDITGYFLATYIPVAIGIIVAVSCLLKRGMNWAAVFVPAIILFSATYSKFIFDLLPSGTGFMFLMLLIERCLQLIKNDGKKWTDFVWVAACAFGMYGAKETNIFFYPGLGIWLLAFAKIQFVALFCAIWVLFYGLETFLLGLLIDIHPLGRLGSLLVSEGSHLTHMLSDARFVRNTWDGGILERWLAANEHPTLYLFGTITMVIVLVQKWRLGDLDKTTLFFSSLLTSFILLNSLFIVNFNPLVLGQPMRPRYLLIGDPLFWIFIYMFFSNIRQSSPILVGVILILMLSINPVRLWASGTQKYDLSIREIFGQFGIQYLYDFRNLKVQPLTKVKYRISSTIQGFKDGPVCVAKNNWKFGRVGRKFVPLTEARYFSRYETHGDYLIFNFDGNTNCDQLPELIEPFKIKYP